MSRNFSIPRSDAKPPSVTTKSASLSPIRVATSELLPCAMFANGPQWTNAGPPSSVWTRFGLIASLGDGHRAGGAELLGGDRLAVDVAPTVIAPSRARRSSRSRDIARIAMTSRRR